MVHIERRGFPGGGEWRVSVETRTGAETVHAYCDTEAQALAQAAAWEAEMDRTGHVVGCPAGASYES